MVEGRNQSGGAGAHEAVTEDVATHIADADGGEFFVLAVDAQLSKVTLDGLPGTAGGDAHGLVVVAHRAAGGEGVTQPEAVVCADGISGVREGCGALVSGYNQVVVVAVAGDNAGIVYDGFAAVSLDS